MKSFSLIKDPFCPTADSLPQTNWFIRLAGAINPFIVFLRRMALCQYPVEAVFPNWVGLAGLALR
jgi:hypothetical protein